MTNLLSFSHLSFTDIDTLFANKRMEYHLHTTKNSSGKIGIFLLESPKYTNLISKYFYRKDNPNACLEVVQARLREKCFRLHGKKFELTTPAKKKIRHLEKTLKTEYLYSKLHNHSIRKHNTNFFNRWLPISRLPSLLIQTTGISLRYFYLNQFDSETLTTNYRIKIVNILNKAQNLNINVLDILNKITHGSNFSPIKY